MRRVCLSVLICLAAFSGVGTEGLRVSVTEDGSTSVSSSIPDWFVGASVGTNAVGESDLVLLDLISPPASLGLRIRSDETGGLWRVAVDSPSWYGGTLGSSLVASGEWISLPDLSVCGFATVGVSLDDERLPSAEIELAAMEPEPELTPSDEGDSGSDSTPEPQEEPMESPESTDEPEGESTPPDADGDGLPDGLEAGGVETLDSFEWYDTTGWQTTYGEPPPEGIQSYFGAVAMALLPSGTVMAGVEQLVDYLSDLHFEEDEIEKYWNNGRLVISECGCFRWLLN